MLNKKSEKARLFTIKFRKFIPIAFIFLVSTFFFSHSKGINAISDLSWENYLGASIQALSLGFIFALLIIKVGLSKNEKDSLHSFSALILIILIFTTLNFISISISVFPIGSNKAVLLNTFTVGIYLCIELLMALILMYRSQEIAITEKDEINFMTNEANIILSDVIYFLETDKLPKAEFEELYEIVTKEPTDYKVYYYLHNSIFLITQRMNRLLRVKVEDNRDKQRLRSEINNMTRDVKFELKMYRDKKLDKLNPKGFEYDKLYLMLLIINDSIDFSSANLEGLIKALEVNKFELNSVTKIEQIYLPELFKMINGGDVNSNDFEEIVLKVKEEVWRNLRECLSQEILENIKF